jgi:hypothetical protein
MGGGGSGHAKGQGNMRALLLQHEPFMRPILKPPLYRTVSLQALDWWQLLLEHLCSIARSTGAHHPENHS